MTQSLTKQEILKREAYEYFNNNIRPIDIFIDDKNIMRVKDDLGHNTDIDAFRHAYVMGRLAMNYPSSTVKKIGINYENDHPSS